MDIDLKITERCQYSMTKEIFWDSAVFTPLRKNSPYTKTISKGYRIQISKLRLNTLSFKLSTVIMY